MRLAQQTIDALEEQMCGFRGLVDGEGNYTFYVTENNTEVEVCVELRYYPPYGIYVKDFTMEAYKEGDWVEIEASQIEQIKQLANELVREYYD
jgi:hypothetical protein